MSKNPRNFTRKGLDQLAQNMLKAYDASLVAGDPRAIPIEVFIEQHFGGPL